MLEDMGCYYYNRGLALIDKNRLWDAVESLKRSLEFGLQKSDCYNLLGLCLFSLGRFQEAVYSWDKSMALDPSADNQAQSYISYVQHKDFQEIIQCYNHALKSALDGDYKKAVKTLENGKLLKLHCVLFHNLYGLCLYVLGYKTRSQSIWMKSLRMDLSNPDTLYYLSEAEAAGPKGILGWIKTLLYLRSN